MAAKECAENIPGCEQAEKAADAAVKKVFAILGVDVDKPESVEEFREDLRFGRRLRRASDRGWLAVTALVFVGAAMAMWAGITGSFKGH